MRRITIAILFCLFFIIGISDILSNNVIVYAAIGDSSYINSFENVPSEEDNCLHYYEESVFPASVTKEGSIVRTCILSDGKRIYSNWSESVSARTKIYSNMNIVSTDHQKYNYKEMVRDISGNQSREYLLYKRGIPGITIEIGSSETPLVLSEFERAWIRNRKLVFLEAALFTE